MIDSLHCGGAQRQLCNLAYGLKQLGHTTSVLVYHPQHEHFRSFLQGHEIQVLDVTKKSGLSFTKRLAAVARKENTDWIIAFLRGPAIYATLAKIIAMGQFKVCVGERSANVERRFTNREYLERCVYHFADLVVANSDFQSSLLRAKFGMMKRKVFSIPNCIDESFFAGRRTNESFLQERKPELLAVGQINPLKNLHGLVDAIDTFKNCYGSPPTIRWAGRIAEGHDAYFNEQVSRIESLGLTKHFKFESQITNIPEFLSHGDALIHPSLLEGFPNAVCEAMASSLPVLVGDIADGSKLVGRNARGFLFDVTDSQSIADSIKSLLSLSGDDCRRMGAAAHSYALEHFRLHNVAQKYADLLSSH